MKRVATLVAAVLVVAGCPRGDEPRPSPTPSATASPTASARAGVRVGLVLPPADALDPLVEQMVRAGVDQLPRNSEVDIDEVRILTPPTEPFRADEIALLADDGYGLVCTIGQQGANDIASIAPRYPRTRFCLLDGELDRIPANVTVVAWRMDEGGFALGAAAALATLGTPGIVTGEGLVVPDTTVAAAARGANHVRPGIALPHQSAASGGEEDAAGAVAVLVGTAPPAGAIAVAGGTGTLRGAVVAAGGAGVPVVAWPADALLAVDEEFAPEVALSVVVRYEVGLAAAAQRDTSGGERFTVGFADGALDVVVGPTGRALADQLDAIIAGIVTGQVVVG